MNACECGSSSEKPSYAQLASSNEKIAEKVEPIVLQVFETGRPFTGMEFQSPRPARPGELRSWLDSFYPVLDLDGTVISVGATVTEITEQKQAEEALAALNRALTEEVAVRTQIEQQMRRLADIVEASPDFVGMADAQGTVLYLNRSFSTALGRSRAPADGSGPAPPHRRAGGRQRRAGPRRAAEG